MDVVGDGFDQGLEKGGRRGPASLSDDLHESEFAYTIDGDIKVQLALYRLHLGDVDVEVADWVALELFPS
jgi:hypothetical protein